MKRSILIIEDEPDTIFFFSRALERASINVILARDRKSGIAKAKEVLPNAIILDLKLPPEGTADEGFRVINELRNDPKTAQIPIMIVTAYVSEENKKHAQRLNAKYYEKPLSEDELIKAVMDMLKKRT